jgi:hypothetical protein
VSEALYGGWRDPGAEWAPPPYPPALPSAPGLWANSHDRTGIGATAASRRQAGAPPPAPSAFGGYETDRAARLLGGFSRAIKGEWVNPDPSYLGQESWNRLVEEEDTGGNSGGRVSSAVVGAVQV